MFLFLCHNRAKDIKEIEISKRNISNDCDDIGISDMQKFLSHKNLKPFNKLNQTHKQTAIIGYQLQEQMRGKKIMNDAKNQQNAQLNSPKNEILKANRSGGFNDLVNHTDEKSKISTCTDFKFDFGHDPASNDAKRRKIMNLHKLNKLVLPKEIDLSNIFDNEDKEIENRIKYLSNSTKSGHSIAKKYNQVLKGIHTPYSIENLITSKNSNPIIFTTSFVKPQEINPSINLKQDGFLSEKEIFPSNKSLYKNLYLKSPPKSLDKQKTLDTYTYVSENDIFQTMRSKTSMTTISTSARVSKKISEEFRRSSPITKIEEFDSNQNLTIGTFLGEYELMDTKFDNGIQSNKASNFPLACKTLSDKNIWYKALHKQTNLRYRKEDDDIIPVIKLKSTICVSPNMNPRSNIMRSIIRKKNKAFGNHLKKQN